MPGTIDLDHVAVASEHRRDAWARYRAELGGEWLGSGATIGFANNQLRYESGMNLEILRPHRVEENDFLRRFLDRSGPGPHHLTFKVADIHVAIDAVTAAGYPPVSVNLEFREWMEAFLHPKASHGRSQTSDRSLVTRRSLSTATTRRAPASAPGAPTRARRSSGARSTKTRPKRPWPQY